VAYTREKKDAYRILMRKPEIDHLKDVNVGGYFKDVD
jgi:hypothetical protein